MVSTTSPLACAFKSDTTHFTGHARSKSQTTSGSCLVVSKCTLIGIGRAHAGSPGTRVYLVCRLRPVYHFAQPRTVHPTPRSYPAVFSRRPEGNRNTPTENAAGLVFLTHSRKPP